MSIRKWLVALTFASLFAGVAGAQEDYTTWSQHKTIFLNTSATGANVQNNVYNFPVLIRLDPSNFSGFSQALLQGADIRFSKGNYTQHLPYQIERWVDGSGFNDTAVIWVKLDTVLGNSTSQSIVIHYGKTGATSQSSGPAVFDTTNGNYKAALHLCEGTARGAQAAFIDASGSGNNGDDSCTNAASAGIIGLGQSFGGGAYTNSSLTSDYIPLRKVGTTFNTNFNNNAQWTISLWVNLTNSNGGGSILYKGNPTRWNNNELCYCFGNQTDTKSNGLYPQLVSWGRDFAWTDGNTPLSTNTWHHLVLTYANAPGSAQFYLDGAALPMDPSHNGYCNAAQADSNRSMWIGRPVNATGDESSAFFQGLMDEFEIANTARSADWVKLAFQNQKLNQTLISVNLPPPVLSAPANGAGSPLPLTLAWNQTPTATSYAVQLSTAFGFTTTVLSQAGVSALSLPVSGLTLSTTYYWKVNATDGVSTTAWSSTWSFMPVTVPAAPVLATPSNGATNQPAASNLTWNSVVSSASYAVQVSTVGSFATTLFLQTGITGTVDSLTGLSPVTTYFWKVNATNAAGSSPWSTVWSFTTSIAPPLAPVLASPGDGAGSRPVNNLSMSWGSAAGATGYILQVASAPDFSTTVVNRANLTTNSAVVGGLTTNTFYYWRVAGTNVAGTGSWSFIWSFSTTSTSTLPHASLTRTIGFSVRSGMIAYSLPEPAAVKISFHDMLGRMVSSVNRIQSAGLYSIAFKDCGLAAGHYIVRFKAADFERRAAITVQR